MTCDFQQCGILTSVDSDKPLQPPLRLETQYSQATSEGSDQTARMRRLV